MSDGAGSTELMLALQRIQARVEERSRAGEYPLGLDEQLRQRFTELVAVESDPRRAAASVHDSLARLVGHPVFDPGNIVTSSRLPGGSTVHHAVAKAVSRQTAGTLQQLQQYRIHLEDLVRVLIDAYVEAITELETNQRIALDRLAEVEDLSARYRGIERRLRSLEDASDG